MEDVKLKSSFVIGVNEADVTLTLCLGGLGSWPDRPAAADWLCDSGTAPLAIRIACDSAR